MKITKRQLRKIIREVGMHDAGLGGSLSFPSGPPPSGGVWPKVQSLGAAMSGYVSDKDVWGPYAESDEVDETVETLDEDDEWGADSAAEKDAFLDSMVEMWLDHLGMSGIDRVAVIQALNNAYQDLTDESR